MKLNNTDWNLIYTYPKQEKKLVKELNNMNLEAYLPTKIENRKWHDRLKKIESPIFPSYVFIRTNSIQLNKIATAKGFISYVKHCNKPVLVKNDIIENIKLALTEANQVQVGHHELPIGKNVVINEGAFKDQTCEIINQEGINKVVVRLEILNRHILINLPVSSVSELIY